MSVIEKIFKKPLVENFDSNQQCDGSTIDEYNGHVDSGRCCYPGITTCADGTCATSIPDLVGPGGQPGIRPGGARFYQQDVNRGRLTQTALDFARTYHPEWLNQIVWGAAKCKCTNEHDCHGHAREVSGTVGNCTCTCEDAWTGADCGTPRPCTRTLHCHNNGEPAHATQDQGCTPCSCDPGWEPPDCRTQTRYTCTRADCNHHGNPNPPVDVDSSDQCACACDGGWVGPKCTHSGQDHCSGHGTPQVDAQGNLTGCACDPGFVGDKCQHSNSGTCHGHGTAQDDGTCVCDNGFSGQRCEVHHDVCTVANNCHGHATDVSGYVDYAAGCSCQCWPDYNLDSDCRTPRTRYGRDNCNNRGEPAHLYADQGPATPCDCDDDSKWSGNNCEIPANAGIPCTGAGGSNPCGNGGTCRDGQDNVRGANDVAGGPTCDCPDGWHGDTCDTAVNEAVQCPQPNPCGNGGTCVNGQPNTPSNRGDGEWHCDCNDGAAGLLCQYTNRETCNGNGTAHADGTCICNAGAAGPRCQYTNSETCNRNGTARNDGTCDCHQHARGDHCEHADDTTCSGNGTVRADGTCNCDDTHIGDNCETPKHTCSRIDCSNQGDSSGYREDMPNGQCQCDCGPGYSGNQCQTQGGCGPLFVANSDVEGGLNAAGGDSRTVQCNPGYSLDGTASANNSITLTCDNPSGHFTLPDGTQATSSNVQCQPLPCTATEVSNSNYNAAGSISGNTGDVRNVVCDDGYGGGGNWRCNPPAVAGDRPTFEGRLCSFGPCETTVPNSSNKTLPLRGGRGQPAIATCDVGYGNEADTRQSQVEWTCDSDAQGNNEFTGPACVQLTPCHRTDCNSHGTATGYKERGCACSCDVGWTGTGCVDQTECTTARNCSGSDKAKSVSGQTFCEIERNDDGSPAWVEPGGGIILNGAGDEYKLGNATASGRSGGRGMVFNITEIDAGTGAIQGLEIVNCGTNYNPGEQLNLWQDGAGTAIRKNPAQIQLVSDDSGCQCECNDNRFGADCSDQGQHCDIDDCGGDKKAESVTGFKSSDGSDTSRCECVCKPGWTGADCSQSSDQDAHACFIHGGLRCPEGAGYSGAPGTGPDGQPDGSMGTCSCVNCPPGYTDGERTQGYDCTTPNNDCTLGSASDADKAPDYASNESGVYYCAHSDKGAEVLTSGSGENGDRMCSCDCKRGDQLTEHCDATRHICSDADGCIAVSVTDEGDGVGTDRRSCIPKRAVYTACFDHSTEGECGSQSNCLWNRTANRCVPNQAVMDACAAASTKDECDQLPDCNFTQQCYPDPTLPRTGYGGAHCTIAQKAINAFTEDEQNIGKGIIYCKHGVAAGTTDNPACICDDGWAQSGDNGLQCDVRARTGRCDEAAQCGRDGDPPCEDGEICTEGSDGVKRCEPECARPPAPAVCLGGDGTRVPECSTFDNNSDSCNRTRYRNTNPEGVTFIENCRYHAEGSDPRGDKTWDHFDRKTRDGACVCDCNTVGGSEGANRAITRDEPHQYTLNASGKCIANCSTISPTDTSCIDAGHTGEELEACKKRRPPCHGRGVCDSTEPGVLGFGKCRCQQGFSGDYCEHKTDGYEDRDCGIGQGAAPTTAQSRDGFDYQCVCDGQWTQTDPNDPTSKCEVGPCQAGPVRTVKAAVNGSDEVELNSASDQPLIREQQMGVRWKGMDSSRGGAIIVTSHVPGNPDTGNPEKVTLSRPVSLSAGQEIFFYRRASPGGVKCSDFDGRYVVSDGNPDPTWTPSPGANDGICEVTDGLYRSCVCKQGWDVETTEEGGSKCTRRCKFGTYGPNCQYRMDGTGPLKEDGKRESLCDLESLDQADLSSLMEYNVEDGLPYRMENSRSSWEVADPTTASGNFQREFKGGAARAASSDNTQCRVITKADGSLDIAYDCLGGGRDPIDVPDPSDPTGVQTISGSSQWMKGTDQNVVSEVVHGTEGQCRRLDDQGNIIFCNDVSSNKQIRELNDYTNADCTQQDCWWESVDINAECDPNNNIAGMSHISPELQEQCRLQPCKRTPCGTLDQSVYQTYHATRNDGLITGCVANEKGGNRGNANACPLLDDYWNSNYPPATTGTGDNLFNAQGLVARQPSQFADGSCAKVLGCDHCGFGYNATCPTTGRLWERDDKSKCGAFIAGGTYRTCLYDESQTPLPVIMDDCAWK